MAQGVQASDFSDIIFEDWKRQVTRTPVTKITDPITGDETLSDGSTEDIYVIFLKRKTKWMFDKEGLIEGGDAYVMTLPNQTINKDDKITINSETYRVQDVIVRNTGPPDNDDMYKYCNLFLVEGA